MEAATEALLAAMREARARYGDTDEPPADEAAIARLAERSRAELGADPPAAYLDLLRRHDGLNDNGLFVYGTGGSGERGFVEANLDWREGGGLDRVLVFGDGNQDLYVLDLDSGAYQVRDRVPSDNIVDRFATFDALLAAALRAHD